MLHCCDALRYVTFDLYLRIMNIVVAVARYLVVRLYFSQRICGKFNLTDNDDHDEMVVGTLG